MTRLSGLAWLALVADWPLTAWYVLLGVLFCVAMLDEALESGSDLLQFLVMAAAIGFPLGVLYALGWAFLWAQSTRIGVAVATWRRSRWHQRTCGSRAIEHDRHNQAHTWCPDCGFLRTPGY